MYRAPRARLNQNHSNGIGNNDVGASDRERKQSGMAAVGATPATMKVVMLLTAGCKPAIYPRAEYTFV
jgi:hypothetical protein